MKIDYTEKNAETEALQEHLRKIAASFERNIAPKVAAMMTDARSGEYSEQFFDAAKAVEKKLDVMRSFWNIEFRTPFKQLEAINNPPEPEPEPEAEEAPAAEPDEGAGSTPES